MKKTAMFILMIFLIISAKNDKTSIKFGLYKVIYSESVFFVYNSKNEKIYLEEIPVITENDIKSVRIEEDITKGSFNLLLILDSAAKIEFGKFTAKNTGNEVAFLINDKLFATAVIREQIKDGLLTLYMRVDYKTAEAWKKMFNK